MNIYREDKYRTSVIMTLERTNVPKAPTPTKLAKGIFYRIILLQCSHQSSIFTEETRIKKKRVNNQTLYAALIHSNWTTFDTEFNWQAIVILLDWSRNQVHNQQVSVATAPFMSRFWV
jgi:hypothetical protein